MRYLFWITGITAAGALQGILNNYMPVYLAPNLFLMFTVYMTFYYGYYTALLGIIFMSYVSSVFSYGSIWFYMFSYITVFYLLNFFKKFFDRKQLAAIIVLSLITTLIYPLFVLFPAVLSEKTMLFKEAFDLSFMQLPGNVAAAYIIFKYAPFMDYKSKTNIQIVS